MSDILISSGSIIEVNGYYCLTSRKPQPGDTFADLEATHVVYGKMLMRICENGAFDLTMKCTIYGPFPACEYIVFVMATESTDPVVLCEQIVSEDVRKGLRTENHVLKLTPK